MSHLRFPGTIVPSALLSRLHPFVRPSSRPLGSIRWLWAMALLIVVPACGGDSSTPMDPDPDERVASSVELDVSELSVNDAASARLTATVRDQHGAAFTTLPQGVSVTWSVADNAVASVQAVGAGLQADVTGERPGQTQVTAGVGTSSAQASVTVNQVATQVAMVSGDGQEGNTGTLLGEALVVRVVDRHGDGVPDVQVTFQVGSGGGSLSAQSAVTDGDGHAETRWTLGPAEGEQTVQAQVQGLGGSPVEYRATAILEIATGTVEGIVTAANGTTPIQGALVRLLDSDAAGDRGTPIASYDGPEATTDNDGRYVLENVPEGTQILVAIRGVFYAEISVDVVQGATVQAPTLLLDASGRLAYVPGEFDAIQDIVRDELNTNLDQLSGADLASSSITSQYDFIFLNCGIDSWEFGTIGATVDNLREYVAQGGALYLSDLELPILELMFPDDIQGDGGGDDGTITAQVVSSSLRAFIAGNPSTVNIVFNLSGWDAVTQHSSNASVLLQASYPGWQGPVENGPLAISMAYGDGQVVYTSFHNNAAATADQVAVLLYFIYGIGGDQTGGMAGMPALDLTPRGTTFPAWVAGAGDHAHEHRSSWPSRR